MRALERELRRLEGRLELEKRAESTLQAERERLIADLERARERAERIERELAKACLLSKKTRGRAVKKVLAENIWRVDAFTAISFRSGINHGRCAFYAGMARGASLGDVVCVRGHGRFRSVHYLGLQHVRADTIRQLEQFS